MKIDSKIIEHCALISDYLNMGRSNLVYILRKFSIIFIKRNCLDPYFFISLNDFASKASFIKNKEGIINNYEKNISDCFKTFD